MTFYSIFDSLKDWLDLIYLFFGAYLAAVIFTDSFNVLNGTFCSLCNFDKVVSTLFTKVSLQKFWTSDSQQWKAFAYHNTFS